MYVRLLKERYGVKVNYIAGCIVTQDLAWSADGYNSVSVPRINAKFGKDIFAECQGEARRDLLARVARHEAESRK